MGLNIKGHELGSGKPICCVPIIAATAPEIIAQAKKLALEAAQMIEWRIDWFEGLQQTAEVLAVLEKLSQCLPHTILLVTYRSGAQGGEGCLEKKEVTDLLLAIAGSHTADLLDVELYESEQPEALIRRLHDKGAVVIASHHNFELTPSADEMTDILETMRAANADIVKLAVMPNQMTDVTRLLSVTAQFHEQHPKQPLVTMSMGAMGLISRVCGESFGSCITFGADGAASAPGQMNKGDLEIVLDKLHQSITSDKRNIYLIGFMGTGKSTVSKELKNLTGRTIIDTDEVLEARAGMSIPQIFDTMGEAAFRQMESELMSELSERTDLIVSCGGGVILREENRMSMKKSGTVVLLTAKPESILDRVKNDEHRPLLAGKKNVEAIAELIAQRQTNYDLAKDVEVATDDRGAIDIAQEILQNV
ncbi:MAG: type I 3-dehydroquinate dehydratase [Lachnospiraceae bacterium]|nr:type I 3-dehydroquinate dehydratase [Lachnospiraceae bacterium]